jgi:hypothetical protein
MNPAQSAYSLGLAVALEEAGLLKHALAINPRLMGAGIGAAAGAGVGAAADSGNRWRGAFLGGVGGGALGYGAGHMMSRPGAAPHVPTPAAAPHPGPVANAMTGAPTLAAHAAPAPRASHPPLPSAPPANAFSTITRMTPQQLAVERAQGMVGHGGGIPTNVHEELSRALNPQKVQQMHAGIGQMLNDEKVLSQKWHTPGSFHLQSHPDLHGAIMQHVVSPEGVYSGKAHGALASMMEAAKGEGINLTPHHIDAMAQHPMYRELAGLGGAAPVVTPSIRDMATPVARRRIAA